MYVAHFEVKKREPKVLHFSALEREPKVIRFSAQEREPIKFTINKDFKMDIN